jgi:hypothetical protein
MVSSVVVTAYSLESTFVGSMIEWAEEAVGPMMGIWAVESPRQNARSLTHPKG